MKVKHVKEKKSNWKVDAHLQNLDGIIEIGIELFIDKLYNEKFKQFLNFHWIQQLVVPHSKIERSKNCRFQIAHINHTLRFTSTTCITTLDVNLKWENFEDFHVLLSLNGNMHLTCIVELS